VTPSQRCVLDSRRGKRRKETGEEGDAGEKKPRRKLRLKKECVRKAERTRLLKKNNYDHRG